MNDFILLGEDGLVAGLLTRKALRLLIRGRQVTCGAGPVLDQVLVPLDIRGVLLHDLPGCLDPIRCPGCVLQAVSGRLCLGVLLLQVQVFGGLVGRLEAVLLGLPPLLPGLPGDLLA